LPTIEIRNYWNNTKQINYNSQSKLRVASTEVDEETFHNLPTNGNLFRNFAQKQWHFPKLIKEKKYVYNIKQTIINENYNAQIIKYTYRITTIKLTFLRIFSSQLINLKNTCCLFSSWCASATCCRNKENFHKITLLYPGK
jgi:hypothetical protein